MSSDNNCNVYFKSFRLKSPFLGLRRQFLVTEIPLKKIKNECAKFCASRAFIPYVPHMPTSLTCLRASRAHVPACFTFFTCITCLHFLRTLYAFTFLNVSNFWRALRAFTYIIKCGTNQKQSQQARIRKNEVG